ncbi:hypothetical protein U1Q18_025272, partial [Sarracenia purpurea var. burkii]
FTYETPINSHLPSSSPSNSTSVSISARQISQSVVASKASPSGILSAIPAIP